MMYVDTELPGKYGGFTHDRFPRPPELFLDSARFIQARSYAIRGLNVRASEPWATPTNPTNMINFTETASQGGWMTVDCLLQTRRLTPALTTQWGLRVPPGATGARPDRVLGSWQCEDGTERQ